MQPDFKQARQLAAVRILLIEDDDTFAALVRANLERAHWADLSIERAASMHDALARLERGGSHMLDRPCDHLLGHNAHLRRRQFERRTILFLAQAIRSAGARPRTHQMTRKNVIATARNVQPKSHSVR